MPSGAATSPVVLFDLDGTLIDSEPVWAAANRSLALSRNAEITEEILASISGLDSTLAMRQIHQEFGWADFDIARDVADVQAAVRQAYAQGLNWLPGARELLADVRERGLRTALVTSTYRELVDIVLAEAGPDSFDAVVCGDDGHPPKPDPAPYMSAISAIGVDPCWCIAIEDSARGVASARAAGCVVLNVSRFRRAELAHAYVESLTEVAIPMLEKLVDAPIHA